MTRKTAPTKAKRVRHKCEYCKGKGFTESGLGLEALQAQYPDYPIRAMVDRGWIRVDEDDYQSCSKSFLAFFNVDSHETLQRDMQERKRFPFNARST